MCVVAHGMNVTAFGRRKGTVFTLKGLLPENGLLAKDPFASQELRCPHSYLIRTGIHRKHQSLLMVED